MPARLIDLSGKSFGKYLVLQYTGGRKYLCRCECGTIKEVFRTALTSGGTQSCGCLIRKITSERSVTHGMRRLPEYEVWRGMKKRCTLKSSDRHGRYLGRGISVCQRWMNSFEAFYADMGPRPIETSIDRIDNDGNYEPGNCRWATVEVQANNKSNHRLLTIDGEIKPLSYWVRLSQFTRMQIRLRLKSMDHKEAVFGGANT